MKGYCRDCIWRDEKRYCRRYPPTMVSYGGYKPTEYVPVVRADGWCGEFTPKKGDEQ